MKGETLDRDDTLHALSLAIDGQEIEAQREMELSRVAQLNGLKLASDQHVMNATRHWNYKAGMVQAAEAIGFTYLELFGH